MNEISHVIEKKAYLARKDLEFFRVPPEVIRIEDWAFAHCSSLSEIWIPNHELQLGKGIFMNCASLRKIVLYEREKDKDIPVDEGIGELLATVPYIFETERLLKPWEIQTDRWLSDYDDRLFDYLKTADEDGFTKVVYCGEEDIVSSPEHFLREKRKTKSYLCFLRLHRDKGLSNSLREYLSDYLRSHTYGCESKAAFECLLEIGKGALEYTDIFIREGCVDENNFSGILEALGDRFPEMKSRILNHNQKIGGADDFFADLLDV